MTFLDYLFFRSRQLDRDIAKWQRAVDSAPDGHLISRKTKNGRYKYSLSGCAGRSERYIPMADRAVAEQLAMKEYAMKRLEDAHSEKYIIDQHIGFMQKERQADHYLTAHPGAAELVLPNLRSKQEYIESWAAADYRRSVYKPENLKYPTVVPGLLVRSKAEADIISRLVHFEIPFRYEEEVVIDGRVFHPDLTCLNVRTLEEIYWEHQGGWDNNSYLEGIKGRETLYAAANIIPFKNLLITTETYDRPLDITWVDWLIQYFLV